MYSFNLVSISKPELFHTLIKDNQSSLKRTYLVKHEEKRFSAIATFHSGNVCDKVIAYVIPFHYTFGYNGTGPDDFARLLTLTENIGTFPEIDFDYFCDKYLKEFERLHYNKGEGYLQVFYEYLVNYWLEPDYSLQTSIEYINAAQKWIDFCQSGKPETPGAW